MKKNLKKIMALTVIVANIMPCISINAQEDKYIKEDFIPCASECVSDSDLEWFDVVADSEEKIEFDNFIMDAGDTASQAILMEEGKEYRIEWNAYSNKNCYNKIILPCNGRIILELAKFNTDIFYKVDIYDSNYSKIQSVDTMGQLNSLYNSMYVDIGLKAGTYYVNIRPQTNSFNTALLNKKLNGYYLYTAMYGSRFEIENNDIPAKANKLYSTYYRHAVLDYMETDYYYFDATKGYSYNIYMRNLEKFESYSIQLIKPSGRGTYIQSKMINTNSDGESYMTYEAEETGRYYISLSSNYGAPIKYSIYYVDKQNRRPTFSDGWNYIDDFPFWYENNERQGTESDSQGVLGDGTVRGREIYDPKSDGWYWLDAVYDGAKAVNKEVWMPYIYQGNDSWDDAEIEMNAANSGDMKNQVIKAIKERSGKWVRYDANGKMYKGWYTVQGSDATLYPSQAGNTYYYDPKTGLMAKGSVTIDGKQYYFDEKTGALK